MSRIRKIVENAILEVKYDLSIPDIETIRECFGLNTLVEKTEEESRIDDIVLEFNKKISTGDLVIDKENKIFHIYVDGIHIIAYPDPNKSTEGGFDPETNIIYIFIEEFKDLYGANAQNTLRHELVHYFDIKDLPSEEKKKLLGLKRGPEYYNNEYEYRAYKTMFISALEELLLKNLSKHDPNIKKKDIPQKVLKQAFEFVKQGKLDLYDEFIRNLNDEHLEDLYKSMLHHFAESYNSGFGSIAFKESSEVLAYYLFRDED